jgi:hypothetical protein
MEALLYYLWLVGAAALCFAAAAGIVYGIAWIAGEAFFDRKRKHNLKVIDEIEQRSKRNDSEG